jgi:NADH dehydrogenase
MEILLKQIKKKRFLLPIPIPIAKVLGRILQVMPKPLLSADQVELMQYDSIVSNKYPTVKDLKIKPKNINEVLPSYIWRHRQEGQFSKL